MNTEPGLLASAQIMSTIKHCARSPATTLHVHAVRTQHGKTINLYLTKKEKVATMCKSKEVVSCKPGDCFSLFNLQYSQNILAGQVVLARYHSSFVYLHIHTVATLM